MPSVDHLTCSVELAGTHLKFSEYGIEHGNNTVACYIAVPPASHEACPFEIRLTADEFPGGSGLAAFVYIDGEYQCNQNRLGMTPANVHEVDLVMGSKEDRLAGGGYLCRDWRFEQIKTTPENGYHQVDRDYSLIGDIDVVVLRTAPSNATIQWQSNKQQNQWKNKQEAQEKKENAEKDKTEASDSEKKAEGEADADLSGGLFDVFAEPEDKVAEPEKKDEEKKADETDPWAVTTDGWTTAAEPTKDPSGWGNTTQDNSDPWNTETKDEKNETTGWGTTDDANNAGWGTTDDNKANDHSFWHTDGDQDKALTGWYGADDQYAKHDSGWGEVAAGYDPRWYTTKPPGKPTMKAKIERSYKLLGQIWGRKKTVPKPKVAPTPKPKSKYYVVSGLDKKTRILATPDGVEITQDGKSAPTSKPRIKLARHISFAEAALRLFGFEAADFQPKIVRQKRYTTPTKVHIRGGVIELDSDEIYSSSTDEDELLETRRQYYTHGSFGTDGGRDHRSSHRRYSSPREKPIEGDFWSRVDENHPKPQHKRHETRARNHSHEPEKRQPKERKERYVYVPEHTTVIVEEDIPHKAHRATRAPRRTPSDSAFYDRRGNWNAHDFPQMPDPRGNFASPPAATPPYSLDLEERRQKSGPHRKPRSSKRYEPRVNSDDDREGGYHGRIVSPTSPILQYGADYTERRRARSRDRKGHPNLLSPVPPPSPPQAYTFNQPAKQHRSLWTPSGRTHFHTFTTAEPIPCKIPEGIASRYALTHRMQLGEGVVSEDKAKREVEYLDSIDRPYATFTFRFRSQKVVEALTGEKVHSWMGGLNRKVTKKAQQKSKVVMGRGAHNGHNGNNGNNGSNDDNGNTGNRENNWQQQGRKGKGKNQNENHGRNQGYNQNQNSVSFKMDLEPATDPRYGEFGELQGRS